MPAEWNHPRRPAKETIDYLTQMEVVIDSLDQSAPTTDDDDSLTPQEVLDNVLEELRHQTASVMEDKKGSVVIEKLARKASPAQLRLMLHRCAGYTLSLANNRYSSHVLQTVLSLTGPILAAEQQHGTAAADSNSDGEGSGTPSMHAIVLALAAEASGAWSELFGDISGSHTARALLQVLGGLPVLAERRGKASKHSHSINTATARATAAAIATTTTAAATSAAIASTPRQLAQAQVDSEAAVKWGWGAGVAELSAEPYADCSAVLSQIAQELQSVPAQALQDMTCHSCACPALVTLVRVLAHSDSIGSADYAARGYPQLRADGAGAALVERALLWQDASESSTVIYGMAGEKVASHFLEAALWLCPAPFAAELCSRAKLYDSSSLKDYCLDPVANFLVQAALQRIDADATVAISSSSKPSSVDGDGAAVIATTEQLPLAAAMVAAAAQLAPQLLHKRRIGVLWRAAQTCVRLSLSSESQAGFLQAVAVAALHSANSSAESAAESSAESSADGSAEKAVSSDPFAAARVWVPAVLELRLPGATAAATEAADAAAVAATVDKKKGSKVVGAVAPGREGKLYMEVTAGRLVENLLRFEPKLAAPVAKALATLPEEMLAAIACDGLASRCLLDPLFDSAGDAMQQSQTATDAQRSLLRAFKGKLAFLAKDRAGSHLLLKLWHTAADSTAAKKAIVSELAAAVAASAGLTAAAEAHAGGRAVMRECMVERFSRDPVEWEAALARRSQREHLLEDILGTAEDSSKKSKKQRKKDKLAAAGSAASAATATATAAADAADAAAEQDEGAKGKRKRARSRGRKSAVGADGADHTAAAAAATEVAITEDSPAAAVASKSKASRTRSDVFMADLGFGAAKPVPSAVTTETNESSGARKKRKHRSGSRDDTTAKAAELSDLSAIMNLVAAGAHEGAEAAEGKKSKKRSRKHSSSDDPVAADAQPSADSVSSSAAVLSENVDDNAAADSKKAKKAAKKAKKRTSSDSGDSSLTPAPDSSEAKQDTKVLKNKARAPAEAAQVAASESKPQKKAKSGFRLF